MFYHNFDSQLYKVLRIHTLGELENLYATLLSFNR